MNLPDIKNILKLLKPLTGNSMILNYLESGQKKIELILFLR